MPKPLNLFFDLDGTLVDPQDGITRSIQYVFQKLGREIPEKDALKAYIGPALRDTFKTLLQTEDTEAIEKAVSLYRERYSKIGVYENVVYPGITDLLDALEKETHSLYLVTTKPTYYAEIILRHFSLARYFQAVYGTEMNGKYDNKGELITHILTSRNLKPAATFMIGDRKQDVSAGKSKGVKTIGVMWGYGSRPEITDASPDYICDHPAGIPVIIRGIR